MKETHAHVKEMAEVIFCERIEMKHPVAVPHRPCCGAVTSAPTDDHSDALLREQMEIIDIFPRSKEKVQNYGAAVAGWERRGGEGGAMRSQRGRGG